MFALQTTTSSVKAPWARHGGFWIGREMVPARPTLGLLGGLLLVALSVPTPSVAASGPTVPLPDEESQLAEHSEHADDSQHPEEGHTHRHHLGAFLGDTRSSHGNGFTVGVEYEFRLQRYFGVGVTAESVGGSVNENIFVGLAYLHPTERLAVFGGGGWERRVGVREQPEPQPKSSGTEAEASEAREPLARIGVLYEIPVSKRVALSPNVSFDFVPGSTVFVYGVTIGLKF